jgi:uncharacterized membrane protein YdcZ (DUF606 family)
MAATKPLRTSGLISSPPCFGGHTMPLGTILLVILVLLLIGAFPRWPHSANWGYFPSGAVGVILIIVVVLLLTGRL